MREKFVREIKKEHARTRTHTFPSVHVVVVFVARSPRVSSSLRASGGRTSDGLENDDDDDDDAEDRRRFVFASVFIIVGRRFGGDVTRVRKTVSSALQRVFRREKRDEVALLDGHEHENSFG